MLYKIIKLRSNKIFMKKSVLFFSIVFGLSYSSIAQTETPTETPSIDPQKKFDKQILPVVARPDQGEFIGFRNPASADLKWLPSLTKISKNESEDEEALEKIKEAKERLRESYRQNNTDQTAEKTTALTGPTLGTNFAGIDNGGGSTPLDNSIAISNGGKIVAMVNSKIRYYTTTGTYTYTNDLPTLVGDASLSTNMCDPKVIYDVVKDRFIIYMQTCDATAASSKVILGFSKSNDPAAGWYFYKLTGNPLGDASWFDYPKMAVTTAEFFVTGNLFHEGSNSFNQAVIYQVDKNACYSGGALSWHYWPVGGGAFTILPVSYGMTGSYGPGMYAVSTPGDYFGLYQIKLYNITNTKASGTAVLNVYDVTTTAYGPAGNADQQGTSHTLNTGDARALDGFLLRGKIHFVFNTDGGGGYCGINYNRLDIKTLTNQSTTYAHSGTSDVCYPALAAMTNDSNDKSVIIAYNETSTTFYPRTMAISVSNNFAWSTPLIVKAGTGYVNYGFGGGTDRWGDYTGMCKKYNDVPATLWMAGMYGNTSHTWSQWIAQLTGKTNIGVPTVSEESVDVKVFPNPVVDIYNISFKLKERQELTIVITDMQGKVVKDLYKGIAEAGDNVFTFNKANLSTGVYFLNIAGDSKFLKTEKIVIENK